VEDEIDSMD